MWLRRTRSLDDLFIRLTPIDAQFLLCKLSLYTMSDLSKRTTKNSKKSGAKQTSHPTVLPSLPATATTTTSTQVPLNTPAPNTTTHHMFHSRRLLDTILLCFGQILPGGFLCIDFSSQLHASHHWWRDWRCCVLGVGGLVAHLLGETDLQSSIPQPQTQG